MAHDEIPALPPGVAAICKGSGKREFAELILKMSRVE